MQVSIISFAKLKKFKMAKKGFFVLIMTAVFVAGVAYAETYVITITISNSTRGTLYFPDVDIYTTCWYTNTSIMRGIYPDHEKQG